MHRYILIAAAVIAATVVVTKVAAVRSFIATNAPLI